MESGISMVERLKALAKKNDRAYKEALRDFRRQFTLRSPEQVAALKQHEEAGK